MSVAENCLAPGEDPIRILIVGGGTAGWITAGYFATLGRRQSTKPLHISLIESDKIPSLGVGEATVPSIRATLSILGLGEDEFIRATDATYKQAIRFDRWAANRTTTYYHPFDRRNVTIPDNALDGWLHSDRQISWGAYISAQVEFCERELLPKSNAVWPDYQSIVPYAYHMDAVKFANLLRRKFAPSQVERFVGTISDVEVGPGGDVSRVRTVEGQEFQADLFIDCSGGNGVLIDEALGVPYISYKDHLLCDSAVVLQTPIESDACVPYTKSIAMNAGWMWQIPLQSRLGMGYVYASDFCDPNFAEIELKSELSEDAESVSLRHLSFDVGRHKSFWQGNVIAMGMAAGFIEPLESTAIYLVEAAASLLSGMLTSSGSGRTALTAAFNQSMTQLYDEVLDFVSLHYILSNRRDTPFWRQAASLERATPRLRQRIELWRHKAPTTFDFAEPQRLFSALSYEHVVFGLRPDWVRPALINERSVAREDNVTNLIQKSAPALTRMSDWLERGEQESKRHG